MFPHEVQATLAKIMFLIFATFIVVLNQARANELSANSVITVNSNKTYSKVYIN